MPNPFRSSRPQGSSKTLHSSYTSKIVNKHTILLINVIIPDLPKSGPRIFGVSRRYTIGDQIKATCISPLSSPPVVLRWYINSDSADASSVSDQSEERLHVGSQSERPVQSSQVLVQSDVSNTESYYKYKLISEEHLQRARKPPAVKPADMYTVSTLNFTVTTKHLRAGRVRLKCSASVLDLYWRSGEVNTQVVDRGSWFQGQFSRSQGRVTFTSCAFIFTIFAHIVSTFAHVSK